MKNEINTLIFDCFGVICDPVLNGWYRDNRIKNGFHDKNIKSVLEKFDLGKLSEDDILNYFLKYEGVKSTKDELRKEIQVLKTRYNPDLEGTGHFNTAISVLEVRVKELEADLNWPFPV